MGFAIVHMQKIKLGAVRGIQSHINREHPPKSNPDVDLSRSGENINHIRPHNYLREIKSTHDMFIVSGKKMRSDAVAVCNFIVTSDEKTMKAMSPETQRAFFEDTLEWFANRYGNRTLLNAVVHMDEKTPHLHIGIMPLTADGRWSAKDLFNKVELTEIQTAFVKDVGGRYGLERGKEGSERTHLTETRYKAAETAKKVVAMQRAIKPLQEKKTALEGEIERLERTVAVLDGAAKKKDTAGVTQFGISEWRQRVAEHRERIDESGRLTLLERFVALPQIAPLFEQFQRILRKRANDKRKNDLNR